ERLALREPARSPSLPRPLGRTLGRHAHPRHHQAAGRRYVCRRETGVAATSAGAFPLLPIRRAHRTSGRLRRGRSRVLRRAAALDMGVQEYRFVRRYLERCPQAPLSLQQVDPLIRELVQYRDFINYKTKEEVEE